MGAYVCVCVGVHATACEWRQKTSCGSLFSPSILWVQAVGLRSSVLEESILTHGGLWNMSAFCFSSFKKKPIFYLIVSANLSQQQEEA